MPTNDDEDTTASANNNKPKRRARRGKKLDAALFTQTTLWEHDILTKQQEIELGQAIQKMLQLQQDLRLHVNAKKEEIATRAQEQQQSEAEWFSLMGEANSKPFHDDDEDEDDDLASLSVMDSGAWYQQQSLGTQDMPRPKSSLEENFESEFLLQDAELDLLSDKEVQGYVGLSKSQAQSILLEGAVARDTMIRSNVRLVVGIARRWAQQQSRGSAMTVREIYQGRWGRPSLEEIIQDGIAGLIQAVERFDPTRNIKFSTFATVYITNRVRICFQTHSTSLAVPPIFHLIRQQLRNRIREYHQSGEEIPSFEQLAEEIGVSPSRLETAMRMTQATLSIDSPMYLDGTASVTLQDFLVGEELAEDIVELSFLRQTLESAMANELGPTERDILRLRLGLDDGVTRTVPQVTEFYGGMLTAPQVRRLEKVALSKLRSPNSLATYKFLAYLDFAGIDSSTAKLD